MERIVGNVLLHTGRDLFRIDEDGKNINGIGDDENVEGKDMTTTNSNENLVLCRDGVDFDNHKDDEGGNSQSCVDDKDNGNGNDNDRNHDHQHHHGNNEDTNEKEQLFQSASSVHQVKDLIYKMAVDESFLRPLMAFKKRIAYINAFGSDFQVPTCTAAFLNEESSFPHYIIEPTNDDDGRTSNNNGPEEKLDFITSIVKTEQDRDIIFTTSNWYRNKSPQLIMSNKLDALGWYKIFIDTRDRIPIPSFQLWNLLGGDNKPCRQKWDEFVEMKKQRNEYSDRDDVLKETFDDEEMEDGMKVVAEVKSKELYHFLTSNDRVQVPAGHSVLVANSKNREYEQFSAEGRPVMDKLGKDFIQDLLGM